MIKKRLPSPRAKKTQPSGNAGRRRIPIGPIAVALVVLLIAAGSGLLFADWWICLPAGTEATYVGRQSCIQCHTQQTHQWTGSHHDLAMDLATDETVLGDFDDVELHHHGLTSRMFRQDDKFMVHTEGPDGEMTDFEVKYVFGVEPLQQYLVEFDRPEDMPEHEIARLQVLRITWDTQRKKWFYLSPPDVDESVERLSPDDDLHWTGIAQRWNNMCADCHSTNLQRNYDVSTKTYHTTFSEIDVSCEACHGPGSVHIQLAQTKSLFWDRKMGYGLAKLKSKDPEVEIQTCAQCHSRRRIVHPNYRPGQDFYDYYANELLGETTYHSDGQILDEVYVHGSFLQSKMYHKGIRCTDCHDPHTARLKHDGNKVCTSCHQHPEGKYDTELHHHHRPGTPGASCVECHMPETTYMDVDPRRDHSMRIPRPDLSVELGTPNACTRCHIDPLKIEPAKRPKLRQYADWLLAARHGDEEIGGELDRLNRWSRDSVVKWYGEKPLQTPHFASVLARARSEESDAEDELIALAADRNIPNIVRGTALEELASSGSQESLKVALRAIKDPNPMVRTAALPRIERQIAMLAGGTPASAPSAATRALQPIVDELIALLDDPVRLVRTESARVLATAPYYLLPQLTSGPQRQALRDALEEFVAGQEVNSDRAAAHMTLAILYENRGDIEKAIRAYETAMKVEPAVTGPRTNLAALHDQLAQRANQQVQTAIAQRDRPTVERLAQEVGRHQVAAEQLRREELDLLARDARLAPDNDAIQYRYGLSLYLHQQPDEAETHLLRAHELAPRVPEYVLALALLYQKLARWQPAIEFAEQLVQMVPGDPSYAQLLREIRNGAAAAPKSSTPPSNPARP